MYRKSQDCALGLAISALLLSGCSSGSPLNSAPPLAPNLRGSATVYPGGYPSTLSAVKTGSSANGYLYVSDIASQSIQVLANGTYRLVGSLPDSLGPTGLWLDSSENLYVGNGFAYSVYEFAPGAKSPSCVYSDDVKLALAIATDTKGHVEIASFDNGQGIYGWVGEFNHCHNRMLRQRMVPGAPEGVAVDAAGDIFVSYINSTGGGSFAEFVRGSMTPKVLGAAVGFSGAIALDSHGNLIADDQNGAIDVISPPYNAVKLFASVAGNPTRLAFNHNYNLLFNANVFAGTVTVYSYPSGTLKKTLNFNGSFGASGVADSPSAQ
jgi:hypothetical protein